MDKSYYLEITWKGEDGSSNSTKHSGLNLSRLEDLIKREKAKEKEEVK